MGRNKYDIHREFIPLKYADILKSFEEARDDRRIAWNCYQQLIGACEAMRDNRMENSFVCCAVNDSIRQQEAEIDEIITRFTGKVYKGFQWIDVREEMKCPSISPARRCSPNRNACTGAESSMRFRAASISRRHARCSSSTTCGTSSPGSTTSICSSTSTPPRPEGVRSDDLFENPDVRP